MAFQILYPPRENSEQELSASVMSDNTIYLITGSNRGIGEALVAALVARPKTTVLATHRTSSAASALAALSRLVPTCHASSVLATLALDLAEPAAGERLAALGMPRLDVVVSCAGASAGEFADVLHTTAADAAADFAVNAVGPLVLFKAAWPLLSKGGGAGAGSGGGEGGESGPKFVLITSSVGSVATLESEAFPSTAYGMSKAAANWLAKKIKVEFSGKGLKVGIIHPGWVKTRMGQKLADTVGAKAPPMGVDESATLVLEQIDKLSEETSGKFISCKGLEIPW